MGWGARFAGVLVVGLLLSACGNSAGPEPQVLSAATGEPTGEPVPTESATPSLDDQAASPFAATGADAQSVQVFVRHWITVANAALRSGDTVGLEALSTASCKTCHNVIDDILDAYADGGMIVGGQLSVKQSSAPELRDGLAPSVEVEASSSAKKELRKDGTVRAESKAERVTFVFFLDRADGAWRVSEIKIGPR